MNSALGDVDILKSYQIQCCWYVSGLIPDIYTTLYKLPVLKVRENLLKYVRLERKATSHN